VTTWPAEDPEWERRLARMERRVGRFAISLTAACLIAVIWTWALTRWPVFDYRVVPSSLPTYTGLISLIAAVGLWLLLRRFGSSTQGATILVGLIVVLAGLGLGASPLNAGGSRGWCRSVIGNVGIHGDDREDCFDARGSRADDVAVVATLGVLITAAGCAPFAQRGAKPSDGQTRTPLGLSDQLEDRQVLADEPT
jgi:hypothetical protein